MKEQGQRQPALTMRGNLIFLNPPFQLQRHENIQQGTPGNTENLRLKFLGQRAALRDRIPLLVWGSTSRAGICPVVTASNYHDGRTQARHPSKRI